MSDTGDQRYQTAVVAEDLLLIRQVYRDLLNSESRHREHAADTPLANFAVGDAHSVQQSAINDDDEAGPNIEAKTIKDICGVPSYDYDPGPNLEVLSTRKIYQVLPRPAGRKDKIVQQRESTGHGTAATRMQDVVADNTERDANNNNVKREYTSRASTSNVRGRRALSHESGKHAASHTYVNVTDGPNLQSFSRRKSHSKHRSNTRESIKDEASFSRRHEKLPKNSGHLKKQFSMPAREMPQLPVHTTGPTSMVNTDIQCKGDNVAQRPGAKGQKKETGGRSTTAVQDVAPQASSQRRMQNSDRIECQPITRQPIAQTIQIVNSREDTFEDTGDVLQGVETEEESPTVLCTSKLLSCLCGCRRGSHG